MTARAHLCLLGLLLVALPGCMEFMQYDDIEKATTRHQLRELEKRFEQFNGTYRIGIPDVLQVNVPDHPDLSGTYEVRPDGNITYPLLRDVYVEGLTPMELSDRLSKELERFVRKVEVEVSVTGMYSKTVYYATRTTSTVRALRFTGDMSVLDALAQVGGYSKEAYSSRIRLMRDNPDRPELYRIRADHIMRGDFSTNVLMKEDDTLYIPATYMAEFGYVFSAITAPIQSLVMGGRVWTEAPYAFSYGQERAQRASPGRAY